MIKFEKWYLVQVSGGVGAIIGVALWNLYIVIPFGIACILGGVIALKCSPAERSQ